MILRVRNISNGTLTINCWNRVLGQSEVIEMESDNTPNEVVDLRDRRMITLNIVKKSEPKASMKKNKDNE